MKFYSKLAWIILLAATSGSALPAANRDAQSWSQRAANAAMVRWPDGRIEPAGAAPVWKYELGTLLQGIDAVWLNTTDPRYFNYIKKSVDQLVGPDGSIPTLKPAENQLDNILLGRQLLQLYGVTQDKRYYTAATQLYKYLAAQPRTPSGGFWHKQRYPNQMWLDGLYMAEPFYAEYAATFHHPEAFSDITQQFVLMDKHARDPKTGLLYHGWDESKQERWADKKTGVSSQFWGRAMGWYMMALVDTLDYYPEYDSGRKQLIAQLERDAAALAQYQDANSGLWYQVLDKAGAKGNYKESSASCMFVYALAKAVRRGYLPARYLMNAERGYKGIVSNFILTGAGDDVSLTGTVKVGGLGGDPYRDGSYAYYIGEKITTNDTKGVGAFLLASAEMENAQNAKLGRGKTVMMDAWFNSQKRPDITGQQVYFHYKWDVQNDTGYSLVSHIFHNFGAKTKTLYVAPTIANLRQAQFYMIVSPDIPAKNPNPHYAEAEDATQIAEWVNAGGVLMIMENDTSFADLDHFNVIAEKFGMHFNSLLRHHVEGTKFEMGKIPVSGGGPIFHKPHNFYMKDICTVSVKSPAASLLSEGDDTFMASAKYGKGFVFATVDPWLYNEYTDGRKLPAEYDNYAGGVELARWILGHVPGISAAPATASGDKNKRAATRP